MSAHEPHTPSRRAFRIWVLCIVAVAAAFVVVAAAGSTVGSANPTPPITTTTSTSSTTSTIPRHPPTGKPTGIHTAVSGTTLRVTFECTSACTVTLTLTVTETIRGGKVIAISARRQKTVKKTVVLATVTVTTGAGHRETVKLSLNRAGRRLLASYHHLKVRLTISSAGTQRPAKKIVVFSSTRTKHR